MSLALSLLVAEALAGGFEVAQQSASAGGTGHASVGRVDAASAWFCPAAGADGKGFRFAAGAAIASATVDASSIGEEPSGEPWQTRTVTPIGTPPHAYASWSDHHILVSLAFNTAFAGGVRWPADSPLRFYSIESAPRFFRLAPSIGGYAGPVRFAAGLHADMGSLYAYRATDHVDEEGSVQLSLRGAGVGLDLSAFLDLPKVDIGLSYKGRTSMRLAGEADFDVPVAFQTTVPDQPIAAPFRLPDRLALGTRVGLGPVDVLADVVYTAWSVNDVLAIDFSNPVTDDIEQVNAWRDTLALRAGAEAGIASIVALRAGAYLDGIPGAPAPTETLGPSSPDGTRIGGTLGAGVDLVEHVRIDAFGEVLAILGRSSTSPDAPAARYRGRALVGGLTAEVRF